MHIPTTITKIGKEAFGSCSELTRVEYPVNSIEYSADMLKGSEGVTTIQIYGEGNMATCSDEKQPWYSIRNKILKVEIGEKVKSIGSYCFEECTTLTTI